MEWTLTPSSAGTNMNECRECDHDGAQEVRVTYTGGSTETLELCDDCATKFEDGGLVTEVERPESCD